MKIAHYIYDYSLSLGGKQQFVCELNDNDSTVFAYQSDITAENIIIGDFNQLIKESTLDFDTIIIHDIKGICIETLLLIKEKNKKIVFIVHDYYACCERYTLINNNDSLCSGPYANNCIYCYVDKFPILSNFQRNTQNLLISIMKPFNKTIKYYKNRLIRMREIMNVFDLIVFPTEKSKQILMRFFNRSINTKIITHFQKKIDCKSIKKEDPIFAYIGHDGYHKGLELLYDAVNHLSNKKIRINMYGNIENKVKDNRFIYRGIFDNEMKNGIFSEFDVLIFPSLWPETWGRVMSEAGICGKYIIASNIVSSEEVLNGYEGIKSFSHNNDKALAKLISDTYKNWSKVKYPFQSPIYKSPKQYLDKIEEALA